MAITVDASTPAIATGTGAGPTLATAAFTPPAGCWIVVMVGAGYANSPTVPGVTVADSSGGGNWESPSSQGSTAGSFFGRASTFRKYFAASPGSITITATFTNLTGGMFLATRVLNGAAVSQASAATAVRNINVAATDWTQAITTTAVGSLVFGVADNPVNSDSLTAFNGATTIIGTPFINGADGVSMAAYVSTTPTTTPGSTTFGLVSGASQTGVVAMLEVLAETTALGPPDGARFELTNFGMGPGEFGSFYRQLPTNTEIVPPTPFTYEWTGEGGTDGATVATSDTGNGRPWDAVTIGTDASIVYDDDSIAGLLSATYDVGATSASAFTQWTVPSVAQHYAGFWFRYTSTPGAGVSIASINAGGTALFRLQINNSDKMRILDANGAIVWLSTTTLTPGEKYYVAYGAFMMPAGVAKLKLYDDTYALIEELTDTPADFGGTVTLVRYGCVANQTSTNWRPLTLDQINYNNYELPTPALISTGSFMVGDSLIGGDDVIGGYDEPAVLNGTGVLAGTLGGLTADLNVTAEDNATLAGTLGALTADLNVTVENNAALAGALGSVTADFNGTSENNAALAGTLSGLTADLNAASETNAALAGTLGTLTADLNVTVENNASFAGTLGSITADFNGTSENNAVLAGNLSGLAGAFTATSEDNAALAGTLAAITADVNGGASGSGALAGTLASLTADINGSVKQNAALAGTLGNVTAELDVAAEDNGILAGTLSGLTADLNGTVEDSTNYGVLAGTLSNMTSDKDVSAEVNGVLAGTFSSVTGDFNGVSESNATLAGTLGQLAADVNGASESNAVLAGTLSGLTSDIDGTVKQTASFAGTLGSVTGDFNASDNNQATLAGTLGGLTADVNGTVKQSGALAGTLGNVTADLNGSAAGGYLNGILSGLQADVAGESSTEGTVAGTLSGITSDVDITGFTQSVMAGTFQSMTADFVGDIPNIATLEGELQSMIGGFASESTGEAALAGVMSSMDAYITGGDPGFIDQSDLMPYFASIYGFHSY